MKLYQQAPSVAVVGISVVTTVSKLAQTVAKKAVCGLVIMVTLAIEIALSNSVFIVRFPCYGYGRAL